MIQGDLFNIILVHSFTIAELTSCRLRQDLKLAGSFGPFDRVLCTRMHPPRTCLGLVLLLIADWALQLSP
jgi:hypothetical protein